MKSLNKVYFRTVLMLLIYPVICYAAGNEKERDLPLAKKLQQQYGNKTEAVCLKAVTVVTFDTNSLHKPHATIECTENLIALKDNLLLVNELGCDDYVNVSDIQAYSANGKPLYTPVTDISDEDGETFYSDERLRVFKMQFDNMGDKMDFEAQTSITDLKYLDRIYMVSHYPFLSDSIIFKVPDWLTIDFKELNYDGLTLQTTTTTDPLKHLTIYTFTCHNLPAGHFDEPNAPGSSYMFPHILIMCKSYTTAGGKNRNIINSVSDLYYWYEELVKEAGNDDEPLKPIVAKLLQGKTTEADKIKAIYYWVEDNIHYRAFENGIAGYKPAPCQKVLSDKFGDCKCMANLLTEMLKIAGFDARRAWLGTNELNYDLSTPSLAVHNHAICVLQLHGKYYYLDATEEYAGLGENGDMIQGREILFENGNGYKIEHIPVTPPEGNKTTINKTLSISNDLITGNANYTYLGDSKTEILYEFHHITAKERDAELKNFIEHHDPNITLTGSKTSNLDDRDVPVNITYTFTIKNQVNQFDKDTYVNIDYDKILEKHIFDSTRFCDYEFDSRINYEVNDTLIIPEGYSVKHLPDNLTIKESGYSFFIKTWQEGNKIIYHKEINVQNQIIYTKNFPAWNNAIKQLKNIYDDQVILTKT